MQDIAVSSIDIDIDRCIADDCTKILNVIL